jgi:hypothetical protein
MHLIRRSVALVLLVVMTVLVPQAANAISYGVPDDGHPNVGSFVVQVTNPDSGATELYQLCTGTLIAPGVVVSASHCFSGLPDFVEDITFTLDPVIDADKDGLVDTAVRRRSGTAVVHPQFDTSGANNPFDVAVFLLDQPVTGVTPARLPTVGLLDQRTVQSQTFVTVGYGTVRETNRTGPQAFQVGWRRMMASQHVNSVTKAWVTFSMNLATGNGGTCFGDSGGPHFLGDVVVAVTVTGDSVCKATDKDYRLDTTYARAFLSRFVTLP